MEKETIRVAKWIKDATIINRTALCKEAEIDRGNLDKYLLKGEIPEQHLSKIIKVIIPYGYNPSPEIKITDATKPNKEVKVLGEKPPKTNFVINTEIPPMPTKNEGEDSFAFAERKNQWKLKYGQK
jgi:hypothetical protein